MEQVLEKISKQMKSAPRYKNPMIKMNGTWCGVNADGVVQLYKSGQTYEANATTRKFLDGRARVVEG